jgi:hypothetical protein
MDRRLSAIFLFASLAACGIDEQRYVVENETVSLTEDAAPVFIDDEDNALYLVERRFEFPIEPPGPRALQTLTARAQGMMLPFPRWPWVEHDDFELTLDYALANMEDRPITAGIAINGANEFFEYAPGPEDFHQWERRIELSPKERVTGSIRALEMDEIAIDLATVVNGAPNSNQVVQFQSQSGRDARIKRYIPATIPGLIALRAGVFSTEAAHVVLELSVRVKDRGDRLVKRGEERWEQPTPTLFVPIVPEEEP